MEEDFPSAIPIEEKFQTTISDKRQTIEIFKETLISGEHFIKHHRFGSPKLRFINLDPETNQLFWRDPNNKENFKGFINFKVHLVSCVRI